MVMVMMNNSGKDGFLADELKNKGNKAFANKQYREAAKLYGDAIQLDVYNPILYANRAQCFLNLGEYDRAYKDSISGLNLGESLQTKIKLNFRKAMALKGLKRWQHAREAFNDVLALDPSNLATKNELQKLPITTPNSSTFTSITSQDKEISIEKVDKLPEPFASLINDKPEPEMVSEPKSKAQLKSNTCAQTGVTNTDEKHSNSDTSALNTEIKNLFGDQSFNDKEKEKEKEEEKKKNSRKESSTSDIKESPLKLLSVLKNLPQSRKLNAYQYVLGLDSQSNSELFEESGIDPDFLQFFLEASQYALTSNLPQAAHIILNHLKQYASMKRFDLAITICDESVKESILNEVEKHHSQYLTAFKQYIRR
ncbi:hypothetical protein KGF56_004477 [Candida oxycetoniae]|uniref:RNA polymerase II-associated protein 3 n=1 Tax=Candida oxycetoniae TaxID=497107 RepID=A0AAI9SUA8_9ASCO|nr:uncharacterized protein KGF56_004477 [Candida oxycetoniae]KAI3402803.2 hypothetical protein KGF56_004477 [Candida oxycetoniae]